MHSTRSLRRGIAYVEILVIVGVVVTLGLAAILALGGGSTRKAEEQAQCIASFGCTSSTPGTTSGAPGALAAVTGDPKAVQPVPQPAPTPTPKPGETPPDDAGDAWQATKDFGYGFLMEGVEMVTGTYQAIRHPVDTVKGLGFIVMHPVQTWDAIYNEWSQRSTAENLGRGVFEIVTLLGPQAASKVLKGAEIVSDVGRIAKVTEAEKAILAAEEAQKATRAAEEAQKATKAAEEAQKAAEARRLAEERRVGEVGQGKPGVETQTEPLPDQKKGEYHPQMQTMSCGAACTRMVVQDATGVNVPEKMIRETATKYGFTEKTGIPFDNLPDVLKEYGTASTLRHGATTSDLARAVGKGERVIAEVDHHVIVVDSVQMTPQGRVFTIRDPNPRVGPQRILEADLQQKLQGGMIEVPLPRR